MTEKKEEPRCSNCPYQARCPQGRQLCDHVCCSLHPHNDAFFHTAKSRNWIEAHKEAANENRD